MSVSCSHGSFGEAKVAESGDCPDCRMARIEKLLELILEAMHAGHELDADGFCFKCRCCSAAVYCDHRNASVVDGKCGRCGSKLELLP